MSRAGLVRTPRIFLLLLFTALCVSSPLLARCQVPPDLALGRPSGTEIPTEVRVGIYLVDFRSIDNARQTFDADIAMMLTWKDARLVADTDFPLAGCTVPLTSIWNPRAGVLNARSLKRERPDQVSIRADGTVEQRQRYMGEFTHSFDLADFPFDHQHVEVSIVSYGFGPDEVAFVIDEEQSGHSERLTITDWAVGAGSVSSEPLFIESVGRSISRIRFGVDVTRLREFYIWKFFLPLTLIVMMSWAVFWINPSFLPSQIGVSTSAVLTFIAFQFSLSYLMPRLSFMTRADRFVMGSTVLVFMAFGEAILTGYLADRDRLESAMKIDRIARVTFPLTFLVVIVFSFWF